MKFNTGLWAIGFAAVLLVTGCDRLPGGSSTPGLLVIDLAAIAEATGHEQLIQEQVQAAREDLNAQLTESVGNLEQQLEDERASLGDAPTQEQEQQLRMLAQQAQQRYGQLQAEAQQMLQQHEINLVQEFREEIRPYAEKIARARNAHVILFADQSMFWRDTTVDVTDELIADLEAAGVFADIAPAADSPPVAD